MKSDIIMTILRIVEDVSEISSADIVSKCKKNDIVEARCLFIYHSFKFGIPTQSLAKFLHRKRTCNITYYLNLHRIYHNQYFSYRIMCREVYDKLSAIYPSIDYKL